MSVTKDIVDSLQGWHAVEITGIKMSERKEVYVWLTDHMDMFDFFVVGGTPYKVAFRYETDATMFALKWIK